MYGPDGGWAGMELIILLPALGAGIVGLIGCYVCRPRDNAWKLSTMLPALVLPLAVFALWHRQNSTTVEITLSDVSGAPLAGVSVRRGAKLICSDSAGKFSLQMQRYETAGFEIMPVRQPQQEFNKALTSWVVGIGPLKCAPDKLEVRHAWTRSVGYDTTLSESFTEIIPFERHVRIPLTLPPHASLDPGPMRERIRSAFTTFQQNPPQDHDYSCVCRNLESVAFIPELIKTYRSNNEQRGSIIKGLASIAEILSEMDKECGNTQKHMLVIPNPPRDLYRDKIAELCVWADIPYNDQSNDLLALKQVREKIASHVNSLIDFSLEEMPHGTYVLNILSELRGLARPCLPKLIKQLQENPPNKIQTAQTWDHVFFMVGARRSELKSLVDSDNPFLKAAANDARPDE